MQGSGQRMLVLEPVEGCNINCTRVSVLLKPTDLCKFLSILRLMLSLEEFVVILLPQ